MTQLPLPAPEQLRRRAAPVTSVAAAAKAAKASAEAVRRLATMLADTEFHRTSGGRVVTCHCCGERDAAINGLCLHCLRLLDRVQRRSVYDRNVKFWRERKPSDPPHLTIVRREKT